MFYFLCPDNPIISNHVLFTYSANPAVFTCLVRHVAIFTYLVLKKVNGTSSTGKGGLEQPV